MENQTPNQNSQTPPLDPQTPTLGINQSPENINPVLPPSISKKKFPVTLIIGIVLFLILAGGAAAGFVYKNKLLSLVSKPKEVACTMEAKVCPDGTSVGRSGPKCEFSKCPVTKITPTPNPTSEWEVYENESLRFRFSYPPHIVFEEEAEIENSSNILLRVNLTDKTSLITMRFAVAENTANLKLGEVLGHGPDTLYIDGFLKGKEIIKRKIDSVDALEVGGLGVGQQGSLRDLIFINGNLIFQFVKTPDLPDNGLFDQILSTFKFTDQTATPTPTPIQSGPTCMPRPACLDATPRCMIPEPADGWCM